ncbi:MAG: asparagine synthase (glutamine-hydrolyzing) [Ktedonobacteraceae bacterium]|nr:asparagine synthase (glutamine-hydrolyzing) [Ktedonobacteraceae bacterium]
MCGIAGFIDVQHGHESAELLIDSMCKVIRHRGPDDQGIWVGDGVALGMRRLSIIDLAGGHQPMLNEDGSILVVFNGEIYNYRELRRNLQDRGHQFQTESDTETIVHAYEEYGDDCVKHFRGMFTFALWDRKRQRLLAARDRFGKKPLNYYWDGQRLIFGSEIKSILKAGISPEINYIALDEYLVYAYVPTPNTLFKHVMKVPPAHILVYEHGQVSTRCYWKLPFTPTSEDDEAIAIEHTRALLEDAVRVRLMSEVPLGAFLSGGVDSSAVVGLMSQMMSQPVKTFSIGFEEEDFTELPYARQVAKQFGTDHHEFLVKPDLIAILPQLVWDYDEPFADSSMLPTYYVSKLAREHVSVALSGDGGDEIFGGYEHYLREYKISRISPVVRTILASGSLLIPDGVRGKKRFGSLRFDLPTRCTRIIQRMPIPRAAMYTKEYFAYVCDHNPYERHLSRYREVVHLDPLTQMQYVDAHVYLPDDILVKVDKASMLNSIETRAPLLDQYLVEYVTSLQPSLRIHNGTLKYLLKQATKDLLPASILSRPKQGFGVPIKHWFRGDLLAYAHEVLESTQAQQRGMFQPQFIHNVLMGHAKTRLVDYSSAIWTLLCLELWFRIYIDEPSLKIEQTPQLQTTGSR